MVEIKAEEVAVIFVPSVENDVKKYVPCEVVEGMYDDIFDRFIDINLYSYSHLTNEEDSRGYALRESIESLKKKYPNTDMSEIKKILLEEYKKYNFYVEYFNSDMFIFKSNKLTDEVEIIFDVDTKRNCFYLFPDNESANLICGMQDDDEKPREKNIKKVKKTVNNVSESSESESEVQRDINPHQLSKEIRKTVKGQEDAIERISTIVWENLNNENSNSNMVLVGSSGVGKTEILRQISEQLDIPVLTVSVAGMSQAGYVGEGTDNILKNLLSLVKGDVEKAERAIVVLDEIDKIAFNSLHDGKVSTDGVQNELLKIIEDGTFFVETTRNGIPRREKINTKNITFICAGAFNGMLTTKTSAHVGFNRDIKEKEITKDNITPEDLIKFGLKPELVGRMGTIIRLNDLNIEVIKDIIKNSKKSVYNSKISFIKNRGISFEPEFEEEIIEEIAKLVIEKKIGARALDCIINEMFTKIMYDISDIENSYNSLQIFKETVTNPKRYVLSRGKNERA